MMLGERSEDPAAFAMVIVDADFDAAWERLTKVLDSFWEVPVVVSTSAWTLAVEEESDRVEAIDIFEKDDEGIEDLVHVVSDYIV